MVVEQSVHGNCNLDLGTPKALSKAYRNDSETLLYRDSSIVAG